MVFIWSADPHIQLSIIFHGGLLPVTAVFFFLLQYFFSTFSPGLGFLAFIA
jgi:hypothetical protein